MSGRRTTIKDVAQAVGVSFKTVSRVLNEESNVRPELRERVRKAASNLGYVPNLAARHLAGGHSSFVGLIFGDANEYYIGKVQLGALEQCRETGHHLIVEPLEPSDDAPYILKQILSQLRVDGLVLAPPVCDNQEVLSAIEGAGVLYVRIAPDRDMDRARFVAVDDRRAAYDMTRYLLALGHREIGLIKGDPCRGATSRHLEGFLRAMGEAGVAVPPERIQAGDFTFGSGLAKARDLLASPTPPSAIFASNDDMALGVMVAASQVGLTVPRDLSVAGFDNSPAALNAWPELTTIQQPVAAMSAAAVDILIEAAHGDGLVANRWIDYQLITRGSTGDPRRQ